MGQAGDSCRRMWLACFNNSVVCQGSEAHCSGIVGSVPGLHDKEGCLTLGPIHKSRVGGGTGTCG